MYNAGVKYINAFYSKSANLEISKRVKDCFDKLNSYTLYLQDIDDIILKKFSKIDFLLLDFTTEILDEHSISLLLKLKEQGYISEIVVILNTSAKDKFSLFKTVYLDHTLESDLKDIVNSNKKDVRSISTKFDSDWIKIISDYLASLGFCQKNNGFLILIDSLVFLLSKNQFSVCLGNCLYPYLVSKYKLKVYAIEMRIRNAILIASKNKNFPFDKCPTIKQFISYAFTQLYGKVYSTKNVITGF